jgi:uncharacterized protein
MAIEMDNSFTVPVPPEQAWDVLLDVERIAPCMPGASVTSVDGDEINGQVKVKLGPLALSYKGTAKFTEKDQASHTFALQASGKETRGAGTASANVQAILKPGDADGTTLVAIHTSLSVTGKPAQFGRSLLPEVSGKLIDQFAVNLEAMVNADSAGPETAGTAAESAATAIGSSGPTTPVTTVVTTPAAAVPVAAPVTQEDSLNAFTFIVAPVLKRVAPYAAAAAGGAAIALAVRRLAVKK